MYNVVIERNESNTQINEIMLPFLVFRPIILGRDYNSNSGMEFTRKPTLGFPLVTNLYCLDNEPEIHIRV